MEGQHSAFQIPTKFSAQLRLRSEALDSRTDAQILDFLSARKPVTSEKNVWAYWHAGLSQMPSWSQRNVINWVRRLGSEWTVRVLDIVDNSPFNVSQYLQPHYLPKAFKDGTMSGRHAGAHRSDLIRGALLYEYGGVWIDVGMILLRHLDQICWNALADEQSPFEVAVPHGGGLSMFNYFIASRKGSPFILKFHEVFLAIWKFRTSCDGINKDPLLKPVFEMQAQLKAAKADITMDTFNEPFAVPSEQIMDYIAQMLCWERVCMIEHDQQDGFMGREYWENKVYLFEGWAETAPAGRMIGWKGQDLFDLLATPLDGPQDERHTMAKEVVWHMLATAAMQKVYTGSMLVNPSLGTLWNRNEGADNAAGTFAELLRYGSVHLDQIREMQRIEAPKPLMTIQKGTLEP